ncbi:MAG: hypothetical protein HYT80_00700 [Euryarchaeota archaeon]|nr:hypothetical protein [Euryarchaeota archaeon]
MQRTASPPNRLPLAGSLFLLSTAIFAGCLGNLGGQSGSWEVSFSPALDLRKCNPSQANLTLQAIAPDLNGEVSELWPSDSSSGPVSVNLQLNDTAFFGNLKCVSSGANGVLSGSFDGASYAGTYRFSGQAGNVTIARSQDCRGGDCYNDCGNQGCYGCQGPNCNQDCGDQGCNNCEGPNCNNNQCGNQGCYNCEGPNCNNNCGYNGCSTQTCGPNTCGEDFSGVWHVSFQPMIDVSSCVGTTRKWSDQDLNVQSNGNFDQVWSAHQPNTLHVFGQLTRGDFHATLECATPNPNGTPRGEMHGPRGQSRYEGVYTFYDSWPPGNVYISRDGYRPPTTSSSPATSAPPTSSSASPTTTSPSPSTTTSSPTSSPAPPGGTWTTKAPMPQPTSGASGAVLNGKLYVVGGNSDGSMFSYDLATNSWSTEPSFPSPYRAYAGAAVVAGKLYIVGGCESQPGTGPDCGVATVNTMRMFDPATGNWSTRAPMASARLHFATAEIGGMIYVAGGIGAGGSQISSFEVYDPATDMWTTKASLPGPRVAPYVGVIGGKLYLAGGSSGANALETAIVYDPSADAWTAAAPMPQARQTGTSGAVNGRLYVVAGQDAAGSNVRDVWDYDPATNTWSTNHPQIPTGRYAPSAGVIGGALLVVAGGPNNSNIATLEAFTP